jgi:hypothetical protein
VAGCSENDSIKGGAFLGQLSDYQVPTQEGLCSVYLDFQITGASRFLLLFQTSRLSG